MRERASHVNYTTRCYRACTDSCFNFRQFVICCLADPMKPCNRSIMRSEIQKEHWPKAEMRFKTYVRSHLRGEISQRCSWLQVANWQNPELRTSNPRSLSLLRRGRSESYLPPRGMRSVASPWSSCEMRIGTRTRLGLKQRSDTMTAYFGFEFVIMAEVSTPR